MDVSKRPLLSEDGTEWCPQIGDLIRINFEKESFEAYVLAVTPKVLDIQYVVDESMEYVKICDLQSRGVQLIKRVQVSSKIRKIFVDPETKKSVPFVGTVSYIWESEGETGTVLQCRVKYEDGDEEDISLQVAIALLVE